MGDEEKLIGQKPGQVDKLISRRKGKKGNEYEVQFVGCQNPIEENSWMSKDALLRMKWTDTSDKKRPEYELGPALTKLMIRSTSASPSKRRALPPRSSPSSTSRSTSTASTSRRSSARTPRSRRSRAARRSRSCWPRACGWSRT